MSFLAAPHHAHLCSEHFSECDFTNPMEYHMGFCFEADTMFQYSFKILPWQAQTDTAVSLCVSWAKCQPWKKETVHKCLWQRKKEQTTNACGKERKKDQTTNAGGKRKMAALIRQANSWHQMKEIKQLKHLRNSNGGLPANIWWGEKRHHQITSLINYCLQQMSGRLQSKP